MQQGPYFDGVAEQSHQAVEKGLKALYIEQRGALPSRTHDLTRLGVDVNVPVDVVADLAVLNPVFNIARYPDPNTNLAPMDLVDAARAAEYLAAAERALTWIGAQLP